MYVLKMRVTATLAAAAAAALLAAWGSSTTSTPTPTANTGQQSAPTSTPGVTNNQAPATVDLSGTWKGQYSGPFNGAFTLNWTQTNGNLAGTIVLSSPPDNLHIDGTVSGKLDQLRRGRGGDVHRYGFWQQHVGLVHRRGQRAERVMEREQVIVAHRALRR